MSSSSSLTDAALLGAATGLRSQAGFAALVLAGRLGGDTRLRNGAILGALGEVLGDKLPVVPPRSRPGPLAGRVGFGAAVGWLAAGATGAAAGAVTAAATTFGGEKLRGAIVERTGWPDPAVAVAEDVLAYAIAAGAAARTVGE